MDKPLAKSLHTVTVLVRVAKLYRSSRDWSAGGTAQEANAYAVSQALEALGLADMPDDYGLAAQAIKQLNK
jgi:hypothetical protein